MDYVRVNGATILKDVPAIFDTGANLIFGDWNRVAEFYRRLNGVLYEQEESGLGYYYLSCHGFPALSLTFGGRTFEIPPEAFNAGEIDKPSVFCFGAVVAQRSHIEFWNFFGIPFLQRVYSVFDYSTLQVGFADLA